MSPFEFVTVFFSVVLGLGVAHLLGGISELIEARARVRTYWIHSVWVITVLLLLVQAWWGLWPLQSAPSWSYVAFLCLVAYQGTLYLLSTLALPRVGYDKVIDLADHFSVIRPIFLSFVAGNFAIGVLLNYSLFSTPLFSIFTVIPGIAVVAVLIGARTASRSYHALLAVFILVGLVALMLSDISTLKP
jgi:hypothetical protein